MRCITKDMIDRRKKANTVYNYILNTPRPDFTELDKESAEFKEWITVEHEKDRQIISEVLDANGRL
ncbi:MAG: hypothetical protein K2N31_08050 [Treponemataceae bacterium]|nr:hypothetical protein [Treponemataceae bacterium]